MIYLRDNSVTGPRTVKQIMDATYQKVLVTSSECQQGDNEGDHNHWVVVDTADLPREWIEIAHAVISLLPARGKDSIARPHHPVARAGPRLKRLGPRHAPSSFASIGRLHGAIRTRSRPRPVSEG